MKKVLVAGHASMFPTEHGGAKSIRNVMELLIAAGVECRMLIKLHPDVPERLRFAGQHRDGLKAFENEFDSWQPELPGGEVGWSYRGVKYRAIPGSSADLARAAEREIESFQPDSFLVCNDSLDEGLELFEVGAKSGRMVFRAQTIHTLPFGPDSMKPNPEVTAAIKQSARIIAPSNHVKDYIQKHLGNEAKVFYPDVFGRPPFPNLGDYHNPYITMINPCPWKGGGIFMKLARSRPDLSFAAVPTWGATPDIIAELESVPNITILEETPRIDEIFAKTRILVVPSICQEAFGLVSPEALLRGVPVIASDFAGLKESTLGAAPLIPVKPLPFDHHELGTDHTKFVWNEPDNDVEPWSRAIDEILATEEGYQARSRHVRQVALEFIDQLANRSITSFFN